MISIPGSLSFAKLVMMLSAPVKSAGHVRYASQDPFIVPMISTPNAINLYECELSLERPS